MAFRLGNPLHSVLRYMRGDDIDETNARILAAAVAARAEAAGPPPSVGVAAGIPAAATDRRRM
jgi:hypothetical protein